MKQKKCKQQQVLRLVSHIHKLKMLLENLKICFLLLYFQN
mgnify:CR=1 FL=1